jgi:hypothetical protein
MWPNGYQYLDLRFLSSGSRTDKSWTPKWSKDFDVLNGVLLLLLVLLESQVQSDGRFWAWKKLVMTIGVALLCLNAFATHVQKVAIRFVMSFRTEQPGHHWKDFREILHFEIYKKLITRLKFWLNSDNSNMIYVNIYINL